MKALISKLRNHLSRFGARILLLCLWLFLSGMTIAGALVSGSSYDEVFHEQYLRDDFLNLHSWLNGDLITQRPLDGSGNALEFLGHIVNVILGNDKWLSTVSTTPHGIAGRHFVMALLGIYGSILVYRLTKLLTRNPVVSMVAATALLAIPMWSGSAFFNPKDTPAAVGLAGLTYLFSKLLKDHDIFATHAEGWSNHKTVKILTSVALSIEAAFFVFISVGTRPGIVSLAGIFTLFAIILLIVKRQIKGVTSLLALLLVGFYASVVVNPLSYDNPLTYFLHEMSVSSRFTEWNGVNLVAGHLMRAQANSWWYELAWVAAQTPLLIELTLIVVAIGLILFWIRKLRAVSISRENYRTLLPTPDVYAILPTLALLIFPLAYSVFFHPVLYNASRHLLMVYPAIAVLFGLAVHKILVLPKKEWQRVVLPILIASSLLAPTWQGLGLFPYNYVYINPVARLFGTNGHWDFDYWKLSLPEAVKLAPPTGVWITYWPNPVPANHPTPYWIAGWIDPNYPDLPPSCQKTYVTRPLGLSTIKLSYLAVCTN